METLANLQLDIQAARARLAAVDDAYYQALQRWSLTQKGSDRLAALQQKRRDAQTSLSDAIRRLVLLGEPQTLLEQMPADVPFLLLPLRLEVRYLSIRHAVRHLHPDDVVDAGKIPAVANQFRTSGFETREDDILTYQVPALHLSSDVTVLSNPALREAALRVKSGKFIKRIPDRAELWVRIYPDELFTESLEKNLQMAELEAGKAFWASLWAGESTEDAWLRLADGTTIPRAAWIAQATRPTNYKPGRPLEGAPVFPAVALKDGPYTRPPVARLLPERFVLRLEKSGHIVEIVGKPVSEPLALGLDPTDDPFNIDATSAFAQDGTKLKAPAPLRWIHDLKAAEETGLAIRVDLAQHPQFAAGVDKIIVLGAKLSADSAEGGRLLNAHLENCLYQEDGLGILPQGTPTNNFAGEKSGASSREIAAQQYFRALWAPPDSESCDEARLAAALGLSRSFHLPNGHTADVDEAQHMNRLLWPATLGYYLLQFFTPALSEADREQARQFFVRYVTSRGLLPVIRLNSQPYGIIPTTAFSQWAYAAGAESDERFLATLWQQFLSKLNTQWQAMAAGIMAVANAGTSAQRLDETFLTMLGQGASSVQFHKQKLVGTGFMDVLRMIQPSTTDDFARDAGFRPAARAAELSAIGLNAAQFKAVTDSYTSTQQRGKIRWHTTDALPLSEERGLQALPEKSWNYLRWLAEAKYDNIWRSDFSQAPAGSEPTNGNAANFTLLSRLSRQAVLRTYLETGLRKIESNPGLWLLKAKDFEPEHLHDQAIAVNPAALSANNVLHQLYRPIIERFGLTAPFSLEPDKLAYLKPIADALNNPASDPALRDIVQLKKTLARLSQLPTARLDRLFTEHLDLCSHRLDAWMLGLLHQRLDKLRKNKPTGIGIGAFGYLLGLKPNPQRSVVFEEVVPEYLAATPASMGQAAIPIVHLDAAKQQGISPDRNWDKAFFYIGDQVNPGIRLNGVTGKLEPEANMNNVQSRGFLHAPSPAQAVAAAILRSGYANHKEDTQAESLALALTAPRTRKALQLLEGIQGGSSLAELLGYYLERSLHEHQLDAFLHDVRKAYPLPRSTDPASTQIQLLRTTDGLAAVEAFRKQPVPPLLNAIAVCLREVDDMLDAVGDVLLAESVFQTTKGNTERAAAALRVLNSGGQMAPLEFIHTAQDGRVVHHRMGIAFGQSTAGDTGKVWTESGSPRVSLCPGLNRWLARQLPDPKAIGISLVLPDGTTQTLTVAQLGIEPLDFILACPTEFRQAEYSQLAQMADAKARSLFNVSQLEVELARSGRPVLALWVDFNDRTHLPADMLSVFEVSAQATALRKTAMESRFLAPDDFRLPGSPAPKDGDIDPARIQKVLTALQGASNPLASIAKELRTRTARLLTAVRANKPFLIQNAVAEVYEATLRAWLYGIENPPARSQFAHATDNYGGLMERAEFMAQTLEERDVRLGALLDAIPAGLMGRPRFVRLEEAASAVFGRGFRLFPDIKLENASEVDAALKGRALLENASPDAVEGWLREAALTRPPLRVYRHVALLREAFQTADIGKSPEVIQLPFRANTAQAWIGGPLLADDVTEGVGVVSLLLEAAGTLDPKKSFSGMLLDEWPEFVPARTTDTGVAFHYNQPNTEPPQAMLLALPPVEGGPWRWDFLMGAVIDALELSKKRLVTLELIAKHNAGLAQVLPGIALPLTPGNNQTPNVEVI